MVSLRDFFNISRRDTAITDFSLLILYKKCLHSRNGFDILSGHYAWEWISRRWRSDSSGGEEEAPRGKKTEIQEEKT